jgi:hypothetical protein
MRAWVIFSTDAGSAVTAQIASDLLEPPRADDHSATSNRSSEAPSIGEKLEMPADLPGSVFGAKLLKLLALPRGPLFSP